MPHILLYKKKKKQKLSQKSILATNFLSSSIGFSLYNFRKSFTLQL